MFGVEDTVLILKANHGTRQNGGRWTMGDRCSRPLWEAGKRKRERNSGRQAGARTWPAVSTISVAKSLPRCLITLLNVFSMVG